MDTTGRITYIAEIDTSKADKDMVRLRAGIDGVADKGNSSLGRLGGAFGKLTQAAKVATLAAGATFAAGATAAAKASWDQVNAVQQAAATLGRYYDSAEEVSQVQQELIKYAQSDMGVLFNRKDLFAAAGNLAMYGSSAKDVSKQVAILSRGMASNVLSWDEMNAVVGRVISSGKLSRTEFEMLAKAGYNLDSSLANTNVTAEEFFDILDNSIPKDISQDMNNIVPVGIRLQTAFRGIGNAILGVNDLQDGFFGGSLGDRIVKGMQAATSTANDLAPKIRDVMKQMLDVADAVWSHLQPSLAAFGGVIKSNVIPMITAVVTSPFAQFMGKTLVSAIKLAIDTMTFFVQHGSNLVNWFVTTTPLITGVVGAFVAYKGAIIALNTVNAIKNGLLVAQGASYMMLNGALVLVKGATVAQTVAQLALNTAMKLNPIGLLVGAIGGIIGAYAIATQRTDSAKSSTDRLNQARKDAKLAAENLKRAEDDLAGAHLSAEGAALQVERAQKTYNDTVAMYGPNSLEAREAAYGLKTAEDSLKDANDRVTEATNNKSDAEDTNVKKKENVKKAEAEKRESFDMTTGSISGQNDQLIGGLIPTLSSLNGRNFSYTVSRHEQTFESKQAATGSGVPYKLPGKYKGGPVSANQPYLVGENRDGSINRTSELFVPKSAGNIVNSRDLQKALSGGGGSSRTTTIGSIYLNSDVDADRFIRRLSGDAEIISTGLIPNRRYA